MNILEEYSCYRIAYKQKESGEILGYSKEYETFEIAEKNINNGSASTNEVETFIIKETVKREYIGSL